MCEKPSIGGLTHPKCQNSISLDGFTSIFEYQGLIKKAISKLKYKFVSDLSGDLAELILSFLGEEKTFVSFCKRNPIFVPIPIHWKRENWRGFNQAKTIGELIAGNLGLEFSQNLLIRTKYSIPQASLSEFDRHANISGSFSLNPSLVIDPQSSIIVFDDVYTTGSTLREACKVLKKAGASSVWGLTLAR